MTGGQAGQNGALIPQTQTQEIQSIKKMISMLVTVCNEKVKTYYVCRVTEPGDMKQELLEFLELFTDLLVNSSDLLKVQLKQKPGLDKGKLKEYEDLIDLCESWYRMENYDENVAIYDIYTDGIELFKKYKTVLATTNLYEAS